MDRLNYNNDIPVEKDPLSNPPSPYLSEEIYVRCHQEHVAEGVPNIEIIAAAKDQANRG